MNKMFQFTGPVVTTITSSGVNGISDSSRVSQYVVLHTQTFPKAAERITHGLDAPI